MLSIVWSGVTGIGTILALILSIEKCYSHVKKYRAKHTPSLIVKLKKKENNHSATLPSWEFVMLNNGPIPVKILKIDVKKEGYTGSEHKRIERRPIEPGSFVPIPQMDISKFKRLLELTPPEKIVIHFEYTTDSSSDKGPYYQRTYEFDGCGETPVKDRNSSPVKVKPTSAQP